MDRAATAGKQITTRLTCMPGDRRRARAARGECSFRPWGRETVHPHGDNTAPHTSVPERASGTK